MDPWIRHPTPYHGGTPPYPGPQEATMGKPSNEGDEWVRQASRRRRVSAVILAKDENGQPPACWICHQPGADTVDHVLSRVKYPELTWDEANLKPAHGGCNSSKGAAASTRDIGSLSRAW